MMMDKLAGETEVLGEKLPSAALSTGNPGRRGGKAVTNRLSYGTAMYIYVCSSRKRLSGVKNFVYIRYLKVCPSYFGPQ
jgi:hypothetical protein